MPVNILGGNVRRTAQAERDHFAMKVAPKLADLFIVGIQHGYAAGVQGLNDFILGARNLCQ